MNAKFSVTPAAQLYSQQHRQNLLCLKEFSPPLDLRRGTYYSGKISQKFPPSKHSKFSQVRSKMVGLSMFGNYMKVVHRDRAKARRGQYSDYFWARSGLELTRLFEMYGAHFAICGLEYLRDWPLQKGPVVFAANHMSTLETLTLCGYITPYMPSTFVVKAALAGGYFAPLICARPYIALERKNPIDDLKIVMREGCEILRGNLPQQPPRSIIIFPQGTREEACFSRSRFNSIAVRLAAKAGVAVVPVAISSSFWSRSPHRAMQYLPLLRPERPVNFAFGRPIGPLEVNGQTKQVQKQVLDFISEHMRQWNIPVLD